MSLASSSYYYQPVTDLQAQECSDMELRDHIERLHQEFPGYGYGRLGRQLRREGIIVNDKKIRRVQSKYQIFPIRWQSFKIATTDSNHDHKVYPILLADKTLTGMNQAWVADITYIRINKGFVFLAAILDRYSRKFIGWAISRRIDAELCVAALKIAIEERQPPPGCIHHCDRGGAVCLPGVYNRDGTSSDPDQHVEDCQSLRQCPHGIVLQNPKIRGGALGQLRVLRRCQPTHSPFHRGGV